MKDNGMMELIEDMVCTVAEKLFGSLKFKRQDGIEVDLTRPWRVAPYKDLIKAKMGDDWFELPLAAKREKAKALDLDIIHALDHGQQRDYLFVIEHCRLPLLVAVILISDCLQPAHIHTKFLEEAQVGFNRCGIGCCRLLGCIAV